MQKWNKIVLLLTGVLMVYGCSTVRKAVSRKEGVNEGEFNVVKLYNEVKRNNLCSDGFVIKKGKIKTNGLKMDGSYAFNARFSQKGDFLISLKGPLSIEVIRVIALKENIYLINKLERIIYKGKREEFLKRYNIPDDFIGLLFGDIQDSIDLSKYHYSGMEEICFENQISAYSEKIIVSRSEKKIVRVDIYNDDDVNSYKMEYSNFKKAGERKYPYEIKLVKKEDNIEILLYLEEIVPYLNEEISFTLPDYRIRSL